VSRSAVPCRLHPVDVPDTRLGQQPFTRAGQLPLGRHVVLPARSIRLGSAPATHRHASVGLGHMMFVELTTGLRCIFCGHGAPIGHGNSNAAAISEELDWRPIGATSPSSLPYALWVISWG
jgi:hypothetical protein